MITQNFQTISMGVDFCFPYTHHILHSGSKVLIELSMQKRVCEGYTWWTDTVDSGLPRIGIAKGYLGVLSYCCIFDLLCKLLWYSVTYVDFFGSGTSMAQNLGSFQL